MIEEGSRDFHYVIVENRSQETFSLLFQNYIEKGTLIITDGHASYPGAVRLNECEQQVVNHPRGFKNAEGFHTNNIENLWSILKYEIKKRRGVLKISLKNFLEEFKFRYINLRSGSSEEINRAFSSIVSFLFENKN